MMYFILNNRPFDIFFGDRQILLEWFVLYKDGGYDPVEIDHQKVVALLAEAPDEDTNVWELCHKTQPPFVYKMEELK